MSADKSKGAELEEQFILRLPLEQAEIIREWLRKSAMSRQKDGEDDAMGDDNDQDQLTLNFSEDMRHASVTVAGQELNSVLVDLPCIIECQKTLDNITLYKSGDISQMLVCTPKGQPLANSKYEHHKKSLKHKFQWPHGVTAPLKNVRKSRFRKTADKKLIAEADVEREVINLYEEDAQAMSVDFRVVEMDENEIRRVDDDDEDEGLEALADDVDDDYDGVATPAPASEYGDDEGRETVDEDMGLDDDEGVEDDHDDDDSLGLSEEGDEDLGLDEDDEAEEEELEDEDDYDDAADEAEVGGAVDYEHEGRDQYRQDLEDERDNEGGEHDNDEEEDDLFGSEEEAADQSGEDEEPEGGALPNKSAMDINQAPAEDSVEYSQLVEKREDLSQKLPALRAKRDEKQRTVDNTKNPALRPRFQAQLDDAIRALAETEAELEAVQMELALYQ